MNILFCHLSGLKAFCNRRLAGEIRIAFVLYKHIGVYLSTENASMKLGSEAMATNYSVIVNSPVITAAINKDSNKVYLSDPVVFTIRHLQVISCLCSDVLCFDFDVTANAFNVTFSSFFEKKPFITILDVSLMHSRTCHSAHECEGYIKFYLKKGVKNTRKQGDACSLLA